MHYKREFTGSVQGCREPALWDTAWDIPVSLYTLLCVCSIQCAVCSVQYVVYSKWYKVCSVKNIMYSLKHLHCRVENCSRDEERQLIQT